jgi:WD40 repeat protein
MRQAPLQTYGSALAFSPSKSEVKSRYWQERLPFIRNVQGGRDTWDPCLQTFTADNRLDSILFSPDGRFLASVSEYRARVLLWDVTTGTSYTINTLAASEIPLAFSPDSQVLASSARGEVELWDVATGKYMQSFKVFHKVRSMQFSPDGKVLVLAARTVELWDIATMSCIQTLDGHTECVRCLALTPCRKILASASDDMTVRLWDFENSSDKLTIRLPGFPKDITFSPDGNILAASVADESIHILDTATGDTIRILGGDIPCVAGSFLADGKTITIVTNNVELQFLDVATGTCKLTLKHGNKICTSSVSQHILATGTVDGMVRLWNTTGVWKGSLEGFDESVSAMAFSSDGESLAVGLVGKTVEIWDSFDKICRLRLKGHHDRIGTVAFSADGKTLASGSWDCTFRLWDLATGACIRTVDTGRCKVHFVKFSPDGKMLAVSTEDLEVPKSRTVTVWDVVTGTCRQTPDSDFYFHNLAFSHDSTVILMASTFSDNDIAKYLQLSRGFRVWDIATGAWKLTITDINANYFDAVAISPDRKTIASSSSSAPGIQTWDASTGHARQLIEYNQYKILNQNLSFSEDGRYLNTNEGPYRLTSGGLATCPDPELSQSAVYIKEKLGSSWVMRGSKPLLQFPPEHSKSSFAFRKNMLVLGNVEGLTFVEFESC